VASAAALVGLQANHAGFLGVFPALGFAALVLPVRLSAVVAGAAVGAVSAASVSNGRTPIAGIVLIDILPRLKAGDSSYYADWSSS